MNDLKLAFRQLLKNPGFAAVAVLTLALGIGATSTVFTLVQGVLLTPPPYPQPEQVVLIPPMRTDGQRYSRGWPSAQWTDWQAQSKSFDSIAGYGWTFNFLVLQDGSESIQGMAVTSDYFRVIGVQPKLGRPFAEKELAPGQTTQIILGHDLWQRRFRGDPAILGQTVRISRYREPLTVIGVMPEGIRFLPSPSQAQEPNYNVNGMVDYWIPALPNPNRSKEPDWDLVGRLRPGVKPAQARAELETLIAQEAREEKKFEGIAANPTPISAELNREGRRLLLPLAGAVGLVFLIASFNAAGLLLARGLRRQAEYAVRSALGARPFQLCRPILVESVVLAVVGGLAGVVLADFCLNALRGFGGIPRMDAVHMNWRVPAFCFGSALVAGVLAALLPAWLSLSRQPATDIKAAGGRTASIGRSERRLLSGVAAGQIALTLALLVGAGLLIQTARALAKVQTGYDTQHVLTMSVTAVGTNYTDFHQQAVERVGRLPGVKAAAFGWGVPLTGNKWEINFDLQDQNEATPVKNTVSLPARSVTLDYFEALSLRFAEGRPFRATDDGKAPLVAIVNRAMADRYFAGRPMLGRMISPSGQTNKIEIVGVLANTRTDALSAVAEPEIYLCFWQKGPFSKHLVVRTLGDPRACAAMVEKELRTIDPTVAVEHVKTLDQLRSDSVASTTFAMNLMVAFALVACLLATVGIFGVLSLTVASRRTELAIRMAVGAQERDVLRLILGDGLRLGGIGVGLGLVIALALAAGLRTFLFGVSPMDPVTLLVMVAAVLSVTLLTSWIPAWRASKVDPMLALRSE